MEWSCCLGIKLDDPVTWGFVVPRCRHLSEVPTVPWTKHICRVLTSGQDELQVPMNETLSVDLVWLLRVW